jgi:putative transcriptional regulator
LRNRLRVLRAERGWSQAELGERLNVSRQTINAIENRRYDPSLPLAFDIARLFGFSIEEVFEPDEVPAPDADHPIVVLDGRDAGG